MRPRQDFMRLISVPVRILRTHSCKSACRLPTEPFVTSPLKLLRKQSQTGFAVNVRALNYLSTVYNSSTSNGQPSLKFCWFSDTRPLSLTMATTSRNTAPDSKEEHVCSDDHEKPDERDNNCTELQQTGLSDEKKAHPAATSQLSKRAQKKVCVNNGRTKYLILIDWYCFCNILIQIYANKKLKIAMFGSCGIAVQDIYIIQIQYSHLKLSKICWCNIFIFGERGIPNKYNKWSNLITPQFNITGCHLRVLWQTVTLFLHVVWNYLITQIHAHTYMQIMHIFKAQTLLSHLDG